MIQKSASFMLPVLGLSISELYDEGLINTYMGDRNYSGENKWGDYFFLLFDSNRLFKPFLDKLRTHSFYVDEYDPEEGKIMFVMKPSAELFENVINPFLEGKYSKIDREYVKLNFPPMIYSNKKWIKSANYRILTKDAELKKYWEEALEVELDADAEVWSRPEKKDEIYAFQEKESESSLRVTEGMAECAN